MSIILVCTPSLRVLVRMIRGQPEESHGPSGSGTGGLTTGERRMRLVVTQNKNVTVTKSRIGDEEDWELVRKGSGESGDTEAKLAAAGNRGLGIGYRTEIVGGVKAGAVARERERAF